MQRVLSLLEREGMRFLTVISVRKNKIMKARLATEKSGSSDPSRRRLVMITQNVMHNRKMGSQSSARSIRRLVMTIHDDTECYVQKINEATTDDKGFVACAKSSSEISLE